MFPPLFFDIGMKDGGHPPGIHKERGQRRKTIYSAGEDLAGQDKLKDANAGLIVRWFLANRHHLTRNREDRQT